MPSKLDDASNLRFLAECFKSNEQNRVDHQKVADVLGIGSPAVRMRFKRLFLALDGKNDDGGRKVQMSGRVSKPHNAQKKLGGGKKGGTKEGFEPRWKAKGVDDGGEDEDEEEVPLSRIRERRLKKEESDGSGMEWKMLPKANAGGFSSVGLEEQQQQQQQQVGGEDWKMLPSDLDAHFPSVGSEMQAYGLGTYGGNGQMVPPPPPLPNYQTQSAMMSTSDATMQYAYSTPYAALPHTYYDAGPGLYLPQQTGLQAEDFQQAQQLAIIPSSAHCRNELQPPSANNTNHDVTASSQ